MSFSQNKKIYLLNDTSKYHGGSWAVVNYLTELLASYSCDLLLEENRREIEIENVLTSDIVMLNGEGTLHDSKPRAIHLLKVLEFAQKNQKETIIFNTSWFNMTNDFDHVLQQLKQFVVRDRLSYDEIIDNHHCYPEMSLDLSYSYPYTSSNKSRDIQFLSTDFYSQEFNCFVFPNGGALEKIPFFNMRKSSWIDTIETFSSSRVLITGRFHGFMACLKTQTRFIAYPGNTPKIDGVLKWFGDDTSLIKDYSSLIMNAKASHRNMSYYSDLFDWANSKKPWIPYFLT